MLWGGGAFGEAVEEVVEGEVGWEGGGGESGEVGVEGGEEGLRLGADRAGFGGVDVVGGGQHPGGTCGLVETGQGLF